MAPENNSFKCPSCGEDMQLNTSSGTLHCNFCNRNEETYTADEEIIDLDFGSIENDADKNNWGVPVKTVFCGKCKCRLVVPEGSIASFCSFCGSENISPSDELSGLRPDFLIPFKTDSQKALSLLQKWIKKRKLAPMPLKREYNNLNMRGIYVPCWSFDSATQSVYTGQAGDKFKADETSTSTSNGKTETKTRKAHKIRWRFISGSYDRKFKDLIYNDSIFDGKTLEKLEPYKLNELMKYEPRLIQGFAVEHCAAGLKPVWERARDFMRKSIQRQVYNTIKRGCDTVGKTNISTKYTDIAFRLMLLPLWISSYVFRNKTYYIYINGQTGVLIGNSPKSFWKIACIIFIIAAILAGLYFLLLYK
jgi:hypothetical protein